MPISLTINNISDNNLSVITIDGNRFGLFWPYQFRIRIISTKPLYIDLTCLSIAILRIDNYYFKGIITQYMEIQNCTNCYEIKLSSPLSLLRYSQTNRTFIDKAFPEIIHSILAVIPLYFNILVNFRKIYQPQLFLAQYNENDCHFLMRLLHENRIMFYLQRDSGITLFDRLSDMPTEKVVHRYTSLSLMNDREDDAFNFQSHISTETVKYKMQTQNADLVPGQLIGLKDHPILDFNRTYRITTIRHCYNKSIYSNQIELVSTDGDIPLRQYKKKKASLILQAEIDKSPDDYPELDDQGRYCVTFYFDQYSNKSHPIKRIQPYGGKTHSQPYGIHYPLRSGSEVAISFENDDLNKPFILGTLSNPLSQNVTTCDNPTQHRIRSWGGNELLLDDSYANSKIILKTHHEAQALKLINSHHASHIQLMCKEGDVQIFSHELMSTYSNNQYFQVGRNHRVTSGEQIVTTRQGDIEIESAKDVVLKSVDNLQYTSDYADINMSAKQDANLKSWQTINITAKYHAVTVQSKNESIHINANSADIVAKGKVDLGSSISLCCGQISFSQVTFIAPIININPPAPSSVPFLVKSRLTTLVQKNAKRKQKSIKIFPLIALNLRADNDNLYFKSQRIANDRYRKDKLSATELAYFANHGNNATLFIHGYNVNYGAFGGKIETQDQETLKRSIFRYQDIFRDRDDLEDQFPDASINGRVLSSSAQLVLNEQVNTIKALYDLIEQPVNEVDALLNGIHSHNWWLHMEWNLNKATQQFDGSDFSRYARMLHIAWQGNPNSSLDYMAALETAKNTAHKLVPVIRQLYAAGVEVNIMAHSLGNQVLLETMNALGKISRDMINCAFMWDAAVPNNALAEERITTDENALYGFPYAARAAKKIITLFSEHDNILGPVNPDNPALWNKAKEAGFSMVLMIKALDMIDHRIGARKIKSVYHIANTFRFPFSDFLQNQSFRDQYYRHWILSHANTNGRHFERHLSNQLMAIKTQYPRAFNLVSIAIASIKYGDKYAIKQWGRYKLHQDIHHPVNDQDCTEVAAIVITVFISDGWEPRVAMGYLGPDVDTIKKFDQKLKIVQQTPWLYSHSGMKSPSAEVMRQIYQKKIWQEESTYHFGTYDK